MSFISPKLTAVGSMTGLLSDCAIFALAKNTNKKKPKLVERLWPVLSNLQLIYLSRHLQFGVYFFFQHTFRPTAFFFVTKYTKIIWRSNRYFYIIGRTGVYIRWRWVDFFLYVPIWWIDLRSLWTNILSVVGRLYETKRIGRSLSFVFVFKIGGGISDLDKSRQGMVWLEFIRSLDDMKKDILLTPLNKYAIRGLVAWSQVKHTRNINFYNFF